MLTPEEYQALAEQVSEKFFADELSVIGFINDYLPTVEFPHQAIKTVAEGVMSKEYKDKLRELLGSPMAVEIDARAYNDASEWLHDKLLSGMTRLYNEYLSGGEHIEWTEEARMREGREADESAGVSWPQLMSHSPDISERLASLGTILDKLGHYLQADQIDKIMKSITK